ncbi:hypothetical protein GCM10010985_50010 [Caballeronia grimmiae]|uniref:Uncharacterized protein n=1 Tax=Caballeronia grimmiae TaxID=1071679 RepID=A0ABQ1S167_9BURK|nr:hypothetical protein GCM10010985_50010 [Caballeronia grimmiae]
MPNVCVAHLGQLRRVYVEASGSISIVWRAQQCPGLAVRPDLDESLLDAIGAPGYFSCWSCSFTVQSDERPTTACPACGFQRWESSVRVPVERTTKTEIEQTSEAWPRYGREGSATEVHVED